MKFNTIAVSLLIAAVSSGSAVAAVKRVDYPEVKIEPALRQQPDAAFQAFWKAFTEAVVSKNAAALFALVGPTFVWTSNRVVVDEFDPGRDALHNFKVAFGFRPVGKNEDGAVPNGPDWEGLALLMSDPSFYSVSSTTSMTCGPLLADATDAATLEKAQKRIQIGEDTGTWYFTEGDTPVAKAPGDTSAPVGRLNKVAFPVLDVHPAAKDGAAVPAPSHYEVLLPSGRTGWIVAGSARPLVSDRLCYAKTVDGRWTIVSLDQAD